MKNALTAAALLFALGTPQAEAQDLQIYFSHGYGYSQLPVRPPVGYSGCEPGRGGYYTSQGRYARSDSQWVHLDQGSVTVHEGSVPSGPCSIVKRKADGIGRESKRRSERTGERTPDVEYLDDPVIRLDQGTADPMNVEGNCGIRCIARDGTEVSVAFLFEHTGVRTAYDRRYGGVVYIDPRRRTNGEIGQEIVEHIPDVCFADSNDTSTRRSRSPRESEPEDESPAERTPTEPSPTPGSEKPTQLRMGYTGRIKDPRQMVFEAGKLLDQALPPEYATNRGQRYRGKNVDIVVRGSDGKPVAAYNFPDGAFGETAREGVTFVDTFSVRGFCEEVMRPLRENGLIKKEFSCPE